MTTVEIDDKVYKLPTSYEEVSLKQYCNAFRGLQTLMDDELDETARLVRLKFNEAVILSRLMGADDELAMDLPFPTYNKLVQKIGYIYDYQTMLDNAKAYVKHNGKMYSIPDVEKMSLRQYIDADMAMKETDDGQQFISLLAVLLLERDGDGFKPYKGEYEEKKEWIGKLKCSEALPLVFHFFRKWQASNKITQASTAMEEIQNRQVLSTQGS